MRITRSKRMMRRKVMKLPSARMMPRPEAQQPLIVVKRDGSLVINDGEWVNDE